MLNNQKILIVEDNADCRELIVFYIRRLGYDVFEATTGLEALEQAHAVHPDLILMDLSLPKMPGNEATAYLKADPSTRDIPVIINTAFEKGAFVESAIAAGAAEVLYKPVSFRALEEVVRRYLSPLLIPSQIAAEPRPTVSACVEP